MELVHDVDEAIAKLMAKLDRLNDREKDFLRRNSVIYRNMTEAIRRSGGGAS
jgi:hypothetical protein